MQRNKRHGSQALDEVGIQDVSASGILSAVERLHVVAGIAESFRSSTEQADGKIGMILVVHPGATMILATQSGVLWSALSGRGATRILVLIFLLVFLVGFLAAGYHLVKALRPRTATPGEVNRFAYPTVAGGACPDIATASVEELCAEAWSLAQNLAATAMTKNHHILAAVRWIIPMVLAVVVCSVIAGHP